MPELIAVLDGGGTKTELVWADAMGNLGRIRIAVGCSPQDSPDWLTPLRQGLAALSNAPKRIVFGIPTLLSKLAESDAPNLSRMTEINAPEVAKIAEVAVLPAQNSKSVHVARTHGHDANAGKYLDFLNLHGPSTYGAFATAPGWGATRAWQAEAQLRAAGLVQYNSLGKAALTPDQSVSVAVRNHCLNPPVAPEIWAAVSDISGKDERKPNART